MDPRTEDKQQGSVQSVEVAGDVLRALLEAEGPRCWTARPTSLSAAARNPLRSMRTRFGFCMQRSGSWL